MAMPDRRTFLTSALTTAAAMAVLSPKGRVWASEASTNSAHVDTRLFNLKDGVSPAQAEASVAKLKRRAAAAGFESPVIGRNFVPTPFPTRFEWVSIVQWPRFAGGTPPEAYGHVRAAMDELASLCRNHVRCDLVGALPAPFARATTGNVRHTVMFTFKADAPGDIRDKIVSDIREMGKLPMVQAYLVEPGSSIGPDPDEMEWQVVGDYKNVEAYRAYSDAPNHLAIRDMFVKNTSRVAFLDAIL
jgi:hypothetical protein